MYKVLDTMATKLTQMTKRQIPDRSVMLTRFKLSQQKRQLREKERKSSESKSSPVLKSTEDKKLKIKTTPKCKKGKEEFHPSKLKRKITSKKIILKSRHELKLIGDGKSCKRKLNLTQKGLKSPPAKRTKSCNDFNSGPPEADGSQSPIYSELGFEEVIRMVDENQSLDDDDLLEILTCPSPVWWEDPPDDEYMEGPIIIAQNSRKDTSLPMFAKQFGNKSSKRKKTPHKLILEPAEATNDSEGDKQDIDNILDSSTLKNINKTNDKFRNKRSKLESLLSVIKNKIDGSHCQSNNIIKKEEASKENWKDKKDMSELKTTHKKTVPNRSKKESETELDDITFANISQQDKDSLKHLENIEIPIEGKSKDLNKTEEKLSFNFGLQSINPYGSLKVIKKSKNITSYVTNNKLKILKIKKMVMNPLAQKKLAQINFFPAKSTLKGQSDSKEKSQNDKNINGIKQYDVNSIRNISLCNDIKEKVIESKIDSENISVSVNEKINDKIVPAKENPNSEDFVTIFKIIANTNDIKENQTNDNLEEIKEFKSENEVADKESKTLDSYYKKCKGRRRDVTKTNIKEDKKEVEKEGFIDEEEELCENCDKKSIIVPSTTDIKYCLKCSSIFDLDECDYCIRKAKFLDKSDSDERLKNFCPSSNKNHAEECRNNSGDTSCA